MARATLVAVPRAELGRWLQERAHASEVLRIFAGEDRGAAADQRTREIVVGLGRGLTEAVVREPGEQMKERVARHDARRLRESVLRARTRFERFVVVARADRRGRDRKQRRRRRTAK